ncbi:hypothetical protein ACQJBY_041865 [Aegilops geniculata]
MVGGDHLTPLSHPLLLLLLHAGYGGGGGAPVVVADAARAVAVEEHPEQRGVEQRVDHPRADAAAPAGHGAPEVHPHHPRVAHQVATQQPQLAPQRHGRRPRREPRGVHPEAEPEGDGVGERGGEDGEHLERLGELEPEEGHGDGGGVREHPGGRPAPAPEHREHAPGRVEVPGEVVGVGPEEDAAGRAGPRREAEEPPERRGPAPAPPRPARVPNLRHRRQQRAGEDGGGDGGHEERVRGGEGPERERLPAAEERVGGEAEGHVGGEEAEEEGPGGEPEARGAPAEADDVRVLRQPVGDVADERGHGPSAGSVARRRKKGRLLPSYGAEDGKGFGEWGPDIYTRLGLLSFVGHHLGGPGQRAGTSPWPRPIPWARARAHEGPTLFLKYG